MKAALVIALAALPAFAEPLLPGDARHAAGLFALHCAGCHAATGEPTKIGASLGAPFLKDPAFMAGHSDDDLAALLLKGNDKHPARFALSPLDVADLIVYLRSGMPQIAEVFPEAASYTAKPYALEGPAQTRAETLIDGDLLPDEKILEVFTVYGGEIPATGPRLVPQDPQQLDALSPRLRKGFVVFGSVDHKPVALALANDFTVQRLVSTSPAAMKAAPAVVGKGAREPGRRKPFVSKSSPEGAVALTRLYARAVECAAMAAKEEADRHIFDAPEKRAGP